MKLNKTIIWLTLMFSLISFILSFVVYSCLQLNSYYNFIFNICIGVFSGSFLSLLTSIISYKHEKVKTLESFYSNTKVLLSFLSKYVTLSTINEKVNFFILYTDIDKTDWHNSYGKISFFINKDKCKLSKKLLFFIKEDNHTYIFKKIYKPLFDFNCKVSEYYIHFNTFLNAGNGNKQVICNYINELEEILLDCKSQTYNSTVCYAKKSKLTTAIRSELGGKYYEIMYPKEKGRNSNGKDEDAHAE